MFQSKLFYRTSRKPSQKAETVSHRLLLKAGFIEQIAAGIYNFLPLGFRVFQKIEGIIREEMNSIGGQEVFLATLQPAKLWQETDRWDNMDPPLFKLRDRHNRELALGPTHEEVITNMVRTRISSYKDLPFALYQIQNKFRNEMRSTGGLLRVREFVMKDLYSFHTTPQDLGQYYWTVKEAYDKIFKRCGLKSILSEAGSGSIGGSECHEFQLPASTGEDKVLCCQKCDYAVNKSEAARQNSCPKCKGKLKEISTIELGHIFKLGDLYSRKMGAYFTDAQGKKKPIFMGCYGIGLGRLLAAIIECDQYHDEEGMIWPASVAPFDAHLLSVENKDKQVQAFAQRTYNSLTREGFEILYDDRKDVSIGEKFVESDLLGIPVRLVISRKTKDKIEYKKRAEDKTELLNIKQVGERLQ